jgi:hypothetical protein
MAVVSVVAEPPVVEVAPTAAAFFGKLTDAADGDADPQPVDTTSPAESATAQKRRSEVTSSR